MNQLQEYRNKKAQQFAQNPKPPVVMPPAPPKKFNQQQPNRQSSNFSNPPFGNQQPRGGIHGLNDFRQNQYQDQDYHYQQQQHQQYQPRGFFNFNQRQQFQNQKPMYPNPPLPHDNGCKKCCFCFFPYFTIKSFAFIVWMVVSLYAIIVSSLVIHYDNQGKTSSCVYYLCGASYGAAVQDNFQIYRWLTPFFIHSSIFTNPSHFAFNTFGYFLSAFQIEYFVGWKYLALLMIPLQICSALFSQNISDQFTISVGASGVIVGFFAFHSMRLFLRLESCNSPYGCRLIIFPIYALVSVAFVPESTDRWGHFGGLIGGLLFSPILFYIPWKQRMEKNKQSNMIISYSFVCIGIMFILTLIMTLFFVLDLDFNSPC